MLHDRGLTAEALAHAVDEAATRDFAPFAFDSDGARTHGGDRGRHGASGRAPIAADRHVSTWDALDRELDAWRERGMRATLWWRDDDAVRDSSALRRMLDMTSRDVPLALAVIPAGLSSRSSQALANAPAVSVLQHGYAHRNHAPPGAAQRGARGQRSVAACTAELHEGYATLTRAFGDRLLPCSCRRGIASMSVSPRHCRAAGFRGLSTFGPRAAATNDASLVVRNTHVDLIAWRTGRTFIGVERALSRTIDHLQARRTGSVDATDVTGILTHHLDLTEDAWTFMRELLARTRDHPAVEWLAVERLFA